MCPGISSILGLRTYGGQTGRQKYGKGDDISVSRRGDIVCRPVLNHICSFFLPPALSIFSHM